MWKRIKKWFQGPTLEEAYENGRHTARMFILEADDESAAADHLYHMSDGAFDNTAVGRAFDRGVEDQLHELGFQAPYQNGQF